MRVFLLQTQSGFCISCFWRCPHTPCLAAHTWQCPCITEKPGTTHETSLRALEGHHASSKSPSRVWDGVEGVARRNGREHCISILTNEGRIKFLNWPSGQIDVGFFLPAAWGMVNWSYGGQRCYSCCSCTWDLLLQNFTCLRKVNWKTLVSGNTWMTHPLILNLVSKQTCMKRPNLDELSFLIVFALPETKRKAPRIWVRVLRNTLNFV